MNHEFAAGEAIPARYPAPPYVVHGPQLFCSHKGKKNCTLPTPNPRAALPVGISIKGKVPTWGRIDVSLTKRYFNPSSTSPGPYVEMPVRGWLKDSGMIR